MSISGQIFGITDPKTFFTAVLLGQKPTAGFTPLSKQNFEISMLGVPSLPSNPSLHHVQNGAVAPANWPSHSPNIQRVSASTTSRSTCL
jgi:hypothetical protein